MNTRLVCVPAVAAGVLAAAVAVGGGACVPPTVSSEERAFAGCPQQPVTLSVVGAFGGTGPFHFQWRRHPRTLPVIVPIPNSDSPTWTIPSTFLSDAGQYDCVITGSCGTVTTPRYRLGVLTPDRASSGGTPGSDGQLTNDDFIVFIDQFFASDVRADIGRTGAESLPDGRFDNNDFIVFIGLFFDYPSCP
ncbi:MAG TPA: immunoglobulin domain-containing protein [Phycisphaerales bacterium]|nr:immunoglobulin domain-containing protein [Phycisphaerales bacterium]